MTRGAASRARFPDLVAAGFAAAGLLASAAPGRAGEAGPALGDPTAISAGLSDLPEEGARPGKAALIEAGALTSAPYDLSLFRDGETRRMRARYGRWTVVCDEIIRMHSRYCSLSAGVTDAAGQIVARLDVSTDDAGRPAALLRLPQGVLLDRPTTLAPERPGAGQATRILRATRCDATSCAAVWGLDAADFDGLKRDGLTLTYHRTTRLDLPGAWLRPADIVVVIGRLPAEGFAEAVAASLQAGPLAEAPSIDGLDLRR